MVSRLVDEGIVRVLVVELNLLSLLNHGIIPSVVDTQSHQINLFTNDRALFNDLILLLEVMCKLCDLLELTVREVDKEYTWPIMTTI
jgi:hypothetical protein